MLHAGQERSFVFAVPSAQVYLAANGTPGDKTLDAKTAAYNKLFVATAKSRYFSMHHRQRRATSSDLAELTLIRPGDSLFLYTDGVYDGSDQVDRNKLESITRKRAEASCDKLPLEQTSRSAFSNNEQW